MAAQDDLEDGAVRSTLPDQKLANPNPGFLHRHRCAATATLAACHQRCRRALAPKIRAGPCLPPARHPLPSLDQSRAYEFAGMMRAVNLLQHPVALDDIAATVVEDPLTSFQHHRPECLRRLRRSPGRATVTDVRRARASPWLARSRRARGGDGPRIHPEECAAPQRWWSRHDLRLRCTLPEDRVSTRPLLTMNFLRTGRAFGIASFLSRRKRSAKRSRRWRFATPMSTVQVSTSRTYPDVDR